jgi:putative hemin transport protein
MNPTEHNAAAWRAQFAQACQRGLRAREAAHAIGLSEGAAMAAHVGFHDQALRAVPLQRDWPALLQALQACGPLMALTRNASTVHEKTGPYENLSIEGQVARVCGPDRELQLFLEHWHAGFVVTQAPDGTHGPMQASLQFYDHSGTAVHKIYPRSATSLVAWAQVLNTWIDPKQFPGFVSTYQPAMALPEHRVSLSDTPACQPLACSAVHSLLMGAAIDALPLRIAVTSPGCRQIHNGLVQRVEPMSLRGMVWLNVLDPGFNLHLREDLIATVWLTEQPGEHGSVTSLKAFDADDGLMVTLSATHAPGEPEPAAWRTLMATLRETDPKSVTA